MIDMKDKEKKDNAKSILYSIITVLSFMLVSMGTAYAFYAASVIGNDDNGDIKIQTTRPTAVAVFENNIIDEMVVPGYSETLKFAITNTSEDPNSFGSYNIIWLIDKKLDSEYFLYKLVGKTYIDGNEVSEDYNKYNKVVNKTIGRVPTLSTTIGTGTINTGATHKYELTLYLKESGTNQTEELSGREFRSKVSIKNEGNI